MRYSHWSCAGITPGAAQKRQEIEGQAPVASGLLLAGVVGGTFGHGEVKFPVAGCAAH